MPCLVRSYTYLGNDNELEELPSNSLLHLPVLASPLNQLFCEDEFGSLTYWIDAKPDHCYLGSLETVPWTSENGGQLVLRKIYFSHASYSAAERRFCGTIDWSAAPHHSAHEIDTQWDADMVFSADFATIEAGATTKHPEGRVDWFGQDEVLFKIAPRIWALERVRTMKLMMVLCSFSSRGRDKVVTPLLPCDLLRMLRGFLMYE